MEKVKKKKKTEKKIPFLMTMVTVCEELRFVTSYLESSGFLIVNHLTM